MKTTTQTATVREMRTLYKRCQEAKSTAETQANITSNNVIQCGDKLSRCIQHAKDAANSWQQVHNLTAAAHSAANRAALHARAAKIYLLLNLITTLLTTTLAITLFLTK